MRAAPILADDAEDFFDMANLSPKKTGLPMVVWVSERGRAQHDVRVKVSRSHGSRARPDDTVSVSVRPDVRLVAGADLTASDLDEVRRWIDLNRDHIVAYWDGRLMTDELMDVLQPI